MTDLETVIQFTQNKGRKDRLVLPNADSRKANLVGLDLNRADLSGAHLENTRLFGADLSGASIDEYCDFRVS